MSNARSREDDIYCYDGLPNVGQDLCQHHIHRQQPQHEQTHVYIKQAGDKSIHWHSVQADDKEENDSSEVCDDEDKRPMQWPYLHSFGSIQQPSSFLESRDFEKAVQAFVQVFLMVFTVVLAWILFCGKYSDDDDKAT